MKELQLIQFRLKAPKGQMNKFGGYRYRSCEDILEAVKPLLNETGCTLTLSDDIVEVGSRIYVQATATIKNATGETEEVTAFAREEESKKGMDASQLSGACSSYARKYALNGLFCIDDTKDADYLYNSAAYTEQQPPLPANVVAEIQGAATLDALKRLWEAHPELTKNTAFVNAVTERKNALK